MSVDIHDLLSFVCLPFCSFTRFLSHLLVGWVSLYPNFGPFSLVVRGCVSSQLIICSPLSFFAIPADGHYRVVTLFQHRRQAYCSGQEARKAGDSRRPPEAPTRRKTFQVARPGRFGVLGLHIAYEPFKTTPTILSSFFTSVPRLQV